MYWHKKKVIHLHMKRRNAGTLLLHFLAAHPSYELRLRYQFRTISRYQFCKVQDVWWYVFWSIEWMKTSRYCSSTSMDLMWTGVPFVRKMTVSPGFSFFASRNVIFFSLQNGGPGRIWTYGVSMSRFYRPLPSPDLDTDPYIIWRGRWDSNSQIGNRKNRSPAFQAGTLPVANTSPCWRRG